VAGTGLVKPGTETNVPEEDCRKRAARKLWCACPELAERALDAGPETTPMLLAPNA